ncbi:MAG: GIY-YIG nuclease family protein [[Eubacterium] siraeum]
MNEIEIFKNARNERAFMNFINSTEFNVLVDSDLEICLEYYKNICNYIKYVTSTINKNNATKLSEKWVLRNLIDDMLLDKSLEENQFAFVYFIRNTETGYVKIGKTKDIQKRIKDIERTFHFLGQNKNKLVLEAIVLCPLYVNSKKLEKYFHNYFESYHINGEWYDVSFDEICDSIIIDFDVNGVLVSIENGSSLLDDENFSEYSIMESNCELRNIIQMKYIIKFSGEFGVFSIFDYLKYMNFKSDKVYSEDLYKFIRNGNAQNLYDNVKNKITELLNFLS